MKRPKTGRKRSKLAQHKFSMICITGVLVVLGITLSVGSISLNQKNREKEQLEIELKAKIEEQEKQSEEIDELEKYVGTDEYVEDVAKDKLGLVYPNEIYFKAE